MRLICGISLVLAASLSSAQNLLANGDFSLGNTGFTTSYDYAAPAENALFPANSYTVVANTVSPFVLNTYGIVDYNDHTSGNGLFMALNGPLTSNSLVWQESLTGLTVGQSYRFGAWVSRWTPNGGPSALLSVLVNGVLVDFFEDPSTPGTWEEHSGLFTATSSNVTIQIRNAQNSDGGDDFALDDLSVEAVPEPGTFAALGLGLWRMLAKRRSRRIR